MEKQTKKIEKQEIEETKQKIKNAEKEIKKIELSEAAKQEEPKKEETISEKEMVLKEGFEEKEVVAKSETVAEEKPKEKEMPSRKINPETVLGIRSKEASEAKSYTRIKTRKLEDAIQKLEKYKDENRILWAKIVGVEYDDPKKKTKVFIKCKWDEIEISIPDSMYFASNKLLGDNYEKLSEERKAEVKYNVASLHIGAIICFTIDSILKLSETDYLIFGNRAKAMLILQDYYFTHNQFPQTEQNTLKIGDIVKAHVIAIKPYNVLVECCGVETYIDNFSISNMPVDNCRDVIERGSTIDVKIKKIYVNDDSNYLTVIGRTCNISEKMDEIKLNSLHLAKLIHLNEKKGTYTFRLSNGLNVLVYKKTIKNFNPNRLVRGDSAIIRIVSKSKENEFLFGLITTLI